MSDRLYLHAVHNGTQYLDHIYPGWWHKIDLTELDMYSFDKHVLSMITGKLVYETKEFVFDSWSTNRARGFVTHRDEGEYFALTAEWHHRIALVKDHRK